MGFFLIGAILGLGVKGLEAVFLRTSQSALSIVYWIWEAIWRPRLFSSQDRGHWAYLRIVDSRFWGEILLSLIAGVLVCLGLAILFLNGNAILTMFWLGLLTGLFGGSLIRTLQSENQTAYDLQSTSYLDAISLLSDMSRSDAHDTVRTALPTADTLILDSLLKQSAQLQLDISQYALSEAMNTSELYKCIKLLSYVYEHSPEMLAPKTAMLLDSKNNSLWRLGVGLLDRLPPAQMEARLMQILNSDDEERRTQLLAVLLEKPQLISDEQLTLLLTDPWPSLRLTAATLLQHRPPADWTQTIVQQLREEPEEPIRLELLKALQDHPPTPNLLETLLHFASGKYSLEATTLAMKPLEKWTETLAGSRIAIAMTELLAHPDLPSSLIQEAVNILHKTPPDVLPELLARLERNGNYDLLHPHLAEHGLTRPQDWQNLIPEGRAAHWALLMLDLLQERLRLRAAFLIDDLLTISLTTKETTLIEIILNANVRYLPALETFRKHIRYSLNNDRSYEGFDRLLPDKAAKLEYLMSLINRAADNCLARQSHQLRNTGHRGYCQQCRCRSQSATFNERKYSLCPRCQDDSALLADVSTVVGRIGGQLPPSTASVVYVSVWDEQQKKALPAEMDELELAADDTLTHEWALTALLEAMQREGYDLAKIKLSIADGFVLPVNTQRMLRESGLQLTQPS